MKKIQGKDGELHIELIKKDKDVIYSEVKRFTKVEDKDGNIVQIPKRTEYWNTLELQAQESKLQSKLKEIQDIKSEVEKL